MQVPKQVDGQSPTGLRRPRWGYPHPGQWWGHGWVHPPQYPYGDDTSVQSALSGDSYSQFYNEYGVYPGARPGAPMYHHHQAIIPPHSAAPSEHSDASNGCESGYHDPAFYPAVDPYGSTHSLASAPVWHMNPNVTYADGTGYMMHPGPSCVPGSPHGAQSMYHQQPTVEESTEYDNAEDTDYYPTEQPSYDQMHVPMSPYWGHLDHVAMMGLATPQGLKTPAATPSRKGQQTPNHGGDPKEGEEKEGEGYYNNTKPIVLRQPHYFGFGTVCC